MKLWVFSLLFMITIVGKSQNRPAPFSEARKAIAKLENEPIVYDSLRKEYLNRLTLGLTYGQRFISSNNRTEAPDLVTFTDFTERRSFFGLNIGYFLGSNLQLGMGVNATILPKEQVISGLTLSNSGFNAQGRGNGGFLLDMHLSTKFYFDYWLFTRPYAALEIGRMNMIAKGFEGAISSLSNRDDLINERTSRVSAAKFQFGVGRRLSPGFMLDLSIGYTITSKGEPIGGITSPGGLTSSFSMIFILNPRKK